MRLVLAKGLLGVMFFATVGLLLAGLVTAQTPPLTHKVEKGDTLWSISEKYYGDPLLWPKLWKMNPFITNPNLLKPGDVLKLTEMKAAEPQKAVEPPKEMPKPPAPPPVRKTGINLSAVGNVNARGYLSRGEVQPLGYVYSADSGKMLLTKGDILFLDFGKREGIKPGDYFGIYRPSPRLKHPITEEDLGYQITARAKVVIVELSKKTVDRDIYRAEIVENYTDTTIGDLVLPFVTVPQCLKPLPADKNLRGIVLEVRDANFTFGTYSIVYLDCGANKGLRTGSVLELVKFKNVPDPDVRGTDHVSLIYEMFNVKTMEELFEKLARESTIYERVVGHMVVLEVRDDTATALVLNSKEQLPKGTFFRGASWVGSPEFLRAHLSCGAE